MPADPAAIDLALQIYLAQLSLLHQKAAERDYWCKQPLDASERIQELNAEIALLRGDARDKRNAVRVLMEEP